MTLTNDFYPCSSLPEGPLLEPLLIAVAEMKLLCFEGTQRFLFESMQLPVDKCVHQHLLGLYNQRPCYVVDIGVLSRIPNDAQWREVRSLLGHVDDFHFNLAGRATQIIQWDRDHRFCGCCGSPTSLTDGDRSRFCHNCNQLFYPRISPCAIVVITRGEHCLLAHLMATRDALAKIISNVFIPTGYHVQAEKNANLLLQSLFKPGKRNLLVLAAFN